MQTIIVFAHVVACAVAAPGLYSTHELHSVPVVKSILTKSSQVIDHGSSHVLHTPLAPVYHAVHVPLYTQAHIPISSKTTVTKSSQQVNHGGHTLVHAVPVVHTPVHVAPVVHASVLHTPVQVHEAKSSQYFHLENSVEHTPEAHVHTPVLVYSSLLPIGSSRHGDSAVSSQSSTTHETKHLISPLYSLHH